MKRQNQITFGLLLGAALTTVGIIGATAGSLAWYAYSRSTKFSFIGTSVAKSALLNVGIIDDAGTPALSDEFIARYNLEREEYDGHSIVFTHATDGLDYRIISEYLFNSGYASSLLFPLTTQARVISDQSQLYLFESPVYGSTTISTDADIQHYVQIPLAFRMDDGNGGSLHDIDVWLTDVSVKASGEKIDQALRVFVENSQRKFLMKPAEKTALSGSTKVGGVLDLDGDGTYDYNLGNGKELYYGQYSGTLTHAADEYGIDKEHAPYDNVNGVEDERQSTFYSKHAEHAKVADLTNVTPFVAEYETFASVKPSINANGDYYEGATGKKITTTNSTDGVGYVTFTIFIEGWDHVVVDRAANYSFNLGLKFEVNK